MQGAGGGTGRDRWHGFIGAFSYRLDYPQNQNLHPTR